MNALLLPPTLVNPSSYLADSLAMGMPGMM